MRLARVAMHVLYEWIRDDLSEMTINGSQAIRQSTSPYYAEILVAVAIEIIFNTNHEVNKLSDTNRTPRLCGIAAWELSGKPWYRWHRRFRRDDTNLDRWYLNLLTDLCHRDMKSSVFIVLNLFEETFEYICIFYNFSVVTWREKPKIQPSARKYSVYSTIWLLMAWGREKPGHRQPSGITIIILEYSGLSTRKVKQWIL